MDNQIKENNNNSELKNENDNEKINDAYNFFYTGMIMPYAGDIPPNGWLLCDGSPISIKKYEKLHLLIKNKCNECPIHGYFFLPNFRNIFLRGANNDVFNFSIKGSDTIKLNVENMPSHTHNVIIEDQGHFHEGVSNYWINSNNGNSVKNTLQRGIDLFNSQTTKSFSNLQIKNDYEGESKPFDILPSYVEINYIIKY